VSDATDGNRSNAAAYTSRLANKRGKLLREFQRLLVLLWPNNKQIRRCRKGSIIAGFLKI